MKNKKQVSFIQLWWKIRAFVPWTCTGLSRCECLNLPPFFRWKPQKGNICEVCENSSPIKAKKSRVFLFIAIIQYNRIFRKNTKKYFLDILVENPACNFKIFFCKSLQSADSATDGVTHWWCNVTFLKQCLWRSGHRISVNHLAVEKQTPSTALRISNANLDQLLWFNPCLSPI